MLGGHQTAQKEVRPATRGSLIIHNHSKNHGNMGCSVQLDTKTSLNTVDSDSLDTGCSNACIAHSCGNMGSSCIFRGQVPSFSHIRSRQTLHFIPDGEEGES